MESVRYDFASDNVAGVAPEAMATLLRANEGAEPAYGADSWTGRAADLIRGLLDADAEVRFLASGTAANALALGALVDRYEAVLAHRYSHLIADEAGAPGFLGGGLGLTALAGDSGRIDPQALEAALAAPEVSHRQTAAALSITNATEFGTVYSDQAFYGLASMAKGQGLQLHMDGARLANAAAAGFDIRGIASHADVLVLGGAKAGLPPSEALVVFDRALARRLDVRLKQAGQLVSKARFLAAPWVGLLESGAWLEHARHANAMARRLASLCPFPLAHAVETNAVFLAMDEPTLERLRAEGWAAYRFLDGSVRLMCSWATTTEAVETLAESLKRQHAQA